MILRILSAEVRDHHRLRLCFDDSTRGEVDVRPLLTGPIFEPLLDPNYFERVALDPICGTVTWPNGADFAPEALQAILKPVATRETEVTAATATPTA